MKCLSAIIIAIVLVTAEAKVVPTSENQQTDTQPQFSDLIREAQTTISKLGTQIQEHLNQDGMIDTIKEQSSNFATNIQSFIANTTEEIKAKTPELENLWTNVKSKLSEAAEKVNINPETTEQVKQLGEKLQENFQTVVNQSQHIVQMASENGGKMKEDIEKIAKHMVEIAAQTSQNLNNQLQQAATPQPQN